jgi:signal peptidase I
MTIRESKALNFKNYALSTSINNRKYKSIKPVDLKTTQSSALSPQSSNLSFHNFEQVCTELLRQGYKVKFGAPGDSMYPTIHDGDLITVQPIKPSKVVVGDIILYRHVNGVTAHRVIDIKAPQSSDLSPQHLFTLRGDAAIVFDDPVHADQILGKVVSIERNGRTLDPYCLRIKLFYQTRRLASRIKRLLF